MDPLEFALDDPGEVVEAGGHEGGHGPLER